MPTCPKAGGFIGAKNSKSFLSQTKELGWKEALRSVNPYKLCEAAAPNRLGWLNLVDITSHSKALDIGAGTGGIACQLAERCSVEAVDVSSVDIEFLKLRRKQDQLTHFNAQIASATDLPFSDNHFDLVTINGVLEWVPLAEPSVNKTAGNSPSLYSGMSLGGAILNSFSENARATSRVGVKDLSPDLVYCRSCNGRNPHLPIRPNS